MEEAAEYLGGDCAEVLGPDGAGGAGPVVAAVPIEGGRRGHHRGIHVLGGDRRDLACGYLVMSRAANETGERRAGTKRGADLWRPRWSG